MGMTNLRELFVDQLRDIYSAEKQIQKALPKMAKNAHSSELRQAFEHHLQQTKGQIERLDRIFDGIHEKKGREVCHAMEGLIAEGEETMKKADDPDVRDAAMIAAAQRVEHYEISSYGTARAFAAFLGENEAASLLQETLDEESQTDKKLTSLAESNINSKARS